MMRLLATQNDPTHRAQWESISHLTGSSNAASSMHWFL